MKRKNLMKENLQSGINFQKKKRKKGRREALYFGDVNNPDDKMSIAGVTESVDANSKENLANSFSISNEAFFTTGQWQKNQTVSREELLVEDVSDLYEEEKK